MRLRAASTARGADPHLSELSYPAHVEAVGWPTPIQALPRLSRLLCGPQLFVKRDDAIGAGMGGNKTRKLEFLVADALAKGCNRLVTLGGLQSNHCRQTAIFAARHGLHCDLVLGGEAPESPLGNLLIDDLLGARLHFAGDRPRDEVVAELVRMWRTNGERPYLIPLGGSTGLGALGYVRAMAEALQQIDHQQLDIDTMVLASSSAGTQAGLVLGAALFGYGGRVLGISIDAPERELCRQVSDIALQAATLLERTDVIDTLQVEVDAHYLGGGYAVVGTLERDAIRVVAETEGLLLDPVYTGRAMGGLIDLIGKGRFDKHQRVLFWHTGGAPALSAFAERLLDGSPCHG